MLLLSLCSWEKQRKKTNSKHAFNYLFEQLLQFEKKKLTKGGTELFIYYLLDLLFSLKILRSI